MGRSIALKTSATTLRLILGIGMTLQLPFLPVYIFAAWCCWPISLVIGAWIMRYRTRSPVRRSNFHQLGYPLQRGSHET
jgi:hypothetical protein